MMARNLVFIRESYAYLHQFCSYGWPVRHAQPNGRGFSVILRYVQSIVFQGRYVYIISISDTINRKSIFCAFYGYIFIYYSCFVTLADILVLLNTYFMETVCLAVS